MKIKWYKSGQMYPIKKSGYNGLSLVWDPVQKDYDIIVNNHVVADKNIVWVEGEIDPQQKSLLESTGYEITDTRPKFPYAIISPESDNYEQVKSELIEKRKKYRMNKLIQMNAVETANVEPNT